MFNATAFYLPNFQSGVAFGKIYTYNDITGELVSTYRDTNGNLNNNPILLDKFGECVIYIDDNITYRYEVRDIENNIVYTLQNITPAKGEPGTPGGPKGETGDKGRTGPQGISGDRGVQGDEGNKGAKGLPLLTSIKAANNNTYNIPAGISEVYITACAGGGSAANWSPYTALIPQKDPLNRTFQSNIAVQVGPNLDQVNTTNTYDFPSFFLSAVNLTPGSGFAGQGTYRSVIKFEDPTITNVIQVFIGNGGAKRTDLSTSLDGNDGTSTRVYANGVLKIELKGGLAGKNIFPANADQVTTFMQNFTGKINYNQGFKSNLIYRTSYDGSNGPGSNYPQGYDANYYSFYSFNTKYYKSVSNVFQLTDVKTSYKMMQFNFNKNTIANQKMLNKFRFLRGQNSLFGSYYTSYGDVKENSYNGFYNTVKSTLNGQGHGAGGDAYISYYKGNYGNQDINGYQNIRLFPLSIDNSFTFFDKDFIKDLVVNFHLNFRVSDSYSTGTLDVPKRDDTSGYWDKLDALELSLKNNSVITLINKKPTFINLKDISQVNTQSASYGGAGTDGYVLIEYGAISVLSPDE